MHINFKGKNCRLMRYFIISFLFFSFYYFFPKRATLGWVSNLLGASHHKIQSIISGNCCGGILIWGVLLPIQQNIQDRSSLAMNFNITNPKDNLASPIVLKIKMRRKIKGRESSWVDFHISLTGSQAKVFHADTDHSPNMPLYLCLQFSFCMQCFLLLEKFYSIFKIQLKIISLRKSFSSYLDRCFLHCGLMDL